MGSCCCCQDSTSRKIDQIGSATNRSDKREYKLLLLGVGSSGKSTIVKQLQKIYGDGFDNEMFQDGTDMIRQNIILGIIKLLWVSEQLVAMSNGSNEYSKCKIDFNDKVIQDAIDYVLRYKASKLDSRANNDANNDGNNNNNNNSNNNNEEIDNYPYHSYNSRNNNININQMNNINNSYNEINKMMENTSGNYNNNNNNSNNNNNNKNGNDSNGNSKPLVNFELVHGDIEWEDLEEISQTLNYLWGLAAVKETFKHCNEFAFPDNMGYFFDEMSKIFSANYQASDDDLIQTRIRTTGIIQHSFSIPMVQNNGSNNKNDKKFRMKIVDVGGQRNERKKWIHLFDSCTAVIFVAALNHYCSKLFEDETKNAMLDSLDLFEEIFGSKWFRNSEMILFLNKHDLFCQKLLDTSLSVCFADWQGPDYRDYSDFSDYKQRYIDNINNNNNNNNNNNSEMHNRQQSMTAESESGIHNNQAVMQLSNKDSSSQLSGLHGNKSLLQYNRNNENNNDNENDNDTSMIEYKVTEDNITRYDTNLDHFFDDPLYVECHRKALSFIAAKYDEIAQRSNSESPVHPKQLYTHITTATDVNVIERVFWDVQSILVRNNLRKGGLALSYP